MLDADPRSIPWLVYERAAQLQAARLVPVQGAVCLRLVRKETPMTIPAWVESSVPCGRCGELVRGRAYDLKKRQSRSSDGLLFCNAKCRLTHRRASCTVCGRSDNLVRGFCSTHYKRARRNGDPMIKQRHSGISDGAVVAGQGFRLIPPQQRPSGLEPAEVAVLMELADGQARSVGLIADVTAYSIRTVRESVYRMRRKYGADAIEIVQYQPTLKFRLKEPIPLA